MLIHNKKYIADRIGNPNLIKVYGLTKNIV